MAEEVIIICKRILMNSLCVCMLWWNHCSFRRFVQQLITHLKCRAAATSHSFLFKRAVAFCCHSEERKKNSCPIRTGNTQRLLSVEGMWCYFRAFCVTVCDFLWTGTAAAADNWNKESKENEKFLSEAYSTREKKQRLATHFITLIVYKHGMRSFQ